MKTVISLLLSLALVAPAFGTVTITLTTGPAPDNVTIGFTSDEPNNVRAFALDITIDDPCARIAEVNCVSTGYNIYPGGITIDDSGVVTDYGTCLANPSQGPDGGTQPGLGTQGVTIEMGSLYEAGVELPPAQSGDLVIITILGCDGDYCPTMDGVTVSVAENTTRGGVVMENPYEIVSVDTSDTAVLHIPFSWGCGCDCWGDIAGSTGPYPDCKVDTADLGKLLALLGPLGGAAPPYQVCPVPPGFECMDIAGVTSPDRDGCINTADLGKLLTYLGPLAIADPPYTAECMYSFPP